MRTWAKFLRLILFRTTGKNQICHSAVTMQEAFVLEEFDYS